MLILGGCASIRTLISGTDREGEPPLRVVPCEALVHIEPSRSDTDLTIEQAIAHNRVFDHFCGSQP